MVKAIRWTEEALAEHRKKLAAGSTGIVTVKVPLKQPAKPKRSKYAAEKVTQAGITHDSKKEARRWDTLNIMQMAGKIADLRRQVPFELAPKVKLAGEARMKPAIRYVSDFCYVENGVLIIEDCKSAPTRKLPAYRIKKHLMKTVLGLDITEI